MRRVLLILALALAGALGVLLMGASPAPFLIASGTGDAGIYLGGSYSTLDFYAADGDVKVRFFRRSLPDTAHRIGPPLSNDECDTTYTIPAGVPWRFVAVYCDSVYYDRTDATQLLISVEP